MTDFWKKIKETELPVVMYGTGDAADRLITLLGERGVRISGVFVSDEFVRNRTFHSFRVLPYSRAKEIFGRMAVVMGFGTHDEKVIAKIREIASENEFYCPCLLSDENGRPFDSEYYISHKSDFDYFRAALTDNRSREVFDGIVAFRLSGDISFLLPVEEEAEESWRNLSITDDETFVDIGAYDGDTIERFITLTKGKYREIIGFEPDGRSFRKAERRLEGVERITLYNELLSDKEESVTFTEGEGRGNTRSLSGKERRTVTLDSMLEGKMPTLLKFDAEGDEEKILEGGKRIIGECGPKLILSVYHRIDDFRVLLGKVRELHPSYSKFTLRTAPSLPDWDIILLVE